MQIIKRKGVIKTEINQLGRLEDQNHKLNISNKINVKSDVFGKLMNFYALAIKKVEEEINNINQEYHEYHLIDHVKSRIKSPKSMLQKMEHKNYELTYQNLIERINDVAGIRIICPFKNNVYVIKSLLEQNSQIHVLNIKDYIAHPKKSGYTSLHMIVEVPVTIENNIVFVKAEIQIRTIAMDFWAELEHDIRYKPQNKVTKYQSKELIKCAKMLNKIKTGMVKIYYN